MKISDSIINIGAKTFDIDLFEGQYPAHNGMRYNSYIVLDDKITLFDGVDKLVVDEWKANLLSNLNGKNLDYFVISHLEPDHSFSIGEVVKLFPNVKIVTNQKSITLIKQFYDIDVTDAVIVTDGSTLNTGKHTLKFITAPMVHWPEVMMTYDEYDKVLFSADAFGRLGAEDTLDDWLDEAREYYTNIVGKYGVQVQNILKKLANTQINAICSLHGPIINENIGYYVDIYNTWSSYKAEVNGVFIAYASVYGNTEKVAYMLKDMLEAKGIEVCISDVARSHSSENVAKAFKYSSMILASPTIDGDMFPIMKDFIHHLISKNYQNRQIGFIENGSWASQSAKQMKLLFENSKNIAFLENVVSIKSAYNDTNYPALCALADELTK